MATIKLRRGTAAQWASANPTLAVGEPGFETDTDKFKIGDGSTAWNSLGYQGGAFTGDAGDVPFTPAGSISSTDVQAAIEEVAAEAGSASTPTGTGFRHVTSGAEDGASKLVEAADVAGSLKPSGTAATTDEALRALGTAAGTALAGNTAVYKAGGTDVAVADGGTGASTASGARTNLGLGTAAVANTGDFDAAGDAAAAQAASQPLDSDLTAIAALTTTSYGRALLALANAGALQTAASLVPGTDVEAHDADLTTIASLAPTNDDVIQRKAGAWTNRTLAQLIADLAALGTTFQPLDSDLTSIAALTTTSYGRSLLETANAAALRTLAGLGTAATSASTDFDATGAAAAAQAASQPLDSDLTAIAALTTTSFGRALLALADAAALRTAAGLGTAATSDTGDFDAAGTAAAAQAASQPLDSDLTAIAALATTSYGRSLLEAANAAALRTLAGLGSAATASSSDFDATGAAAAAQAASQPLDSDLTAIAALTTTSFGRSLLALADAAALRTAASLVPGTDVQAYDAELAALAGLASAADKLPYFTGAGTAALADLSSFIRTLLDDANASTARTTLGLGTAATAASGDFDAAGAAAAAQSASQPVDSDLTAIAALTTTSYGRAFLALADAAAGRTALGLGTLATQSGTFSGTSSGTNTGDQTTVSGNAGTATALQTARNIDGQAFDGTAPITVIAPGTHAATSKATPVDADELPLVDSAASNVLKKLTWANLKATLKSYFDTLYDATGAAAAAQNASQPVDADLTSIAALSTTTFGRSILTLASAIALRNGGGREPNVTTADDSITAGTSVHIAGDYEIGSGFDTEAGLNAYLEVT